MIFFSGKKERLNHALSMLLVMLSGFLQPACGEDDLFLPGNIFTGINLLDESSLAEEVMGVLDRLEE